MSDQPKQTNADEIDLGHLFKIIGNIFDRLFNFIASIFKGLFHALIVTLIFLQKNFVVLAIAAVIGGAAGFALDVYLPEKYVSKMLVEPNFNSAQQLYNNIEFYDDLAAAEDSITLASALSVTVSDAASIKSVSVDSYSDENQKVKLFDEFIRNLDTTTVKAMDFKGYLENFNSLDARFHQITIVATNDNVAKKVQPTIIKSISSNEYFKLQKNISDENLLLRDSIIRNQLNEIDGLQELYKDVLVKEAEKPMQGTNINLAENGESQNKELALIQEREKLKNLLVRLNNERANKSSILNVISDFPARGVKEGGLLKSYKFLAPAILVAFVIFILLLKQLNRFLSNYRK